MRLEELLIGQMLVATPTARPSDEVDRSLQTMGKRFADPADKHS